MTEDFLLPAGCVVRPACSADRPAIQTLLNQFRQEISPPLTWQERLMKFFAIVLVLGTVASIVSAVGIKPLINLVLGPVLVLGLAVLTVLLLTMNEGWEHFWVIEHDQQLIACAKLRRHKHYSLLHDLYVLPEWRSQGVGSYLVFLLTTQATKPLYLTCKQRLIQFYMRFGFMPIAIQNLSPMIQYDLGIPGRLDVVPLVLR